MKKCNDIPHKGKMLINVLQSLCICVIIYIIIHTFRDKIYNALNILIAFLSGALFFALITCIEYYNRYMQLSKSIDKVKRQSLTDNLTDLYNRSYLEPFLERELEHAKKKNQMLSVIMVDMDHFKHINDTYGHIVGDHVLTIFAQVILKCIRKTDVIARYGGDEFVVVLPNTDTETAKFIAERIRHDVSEMYIPPIEGVVIPSIHCSVGVSTYPVHCDSRNSLIYTSDLALYMAKRSGRNCIRVYENEFALG